MDRHEVRDGESTKDVTDAKIDLTNAKESLHVLEGRDFMDRSEILIPIEQRDRAQTEMVTTSARLQVVERALTTTFDDLESHSSNVQMA